MPRVRLAVFIVLGQMTWAHAADMSVKLKTTDGTTALSIQNASAVEVSSMNSLGDAYFRNMYASSLVVNNSVIVSTSGHLSGVGGAPTVSATATVGSFTSSLSGTDTAGEITLTSGIVAVGGVVVTVTFNTPYATPPYVVFSPSNSSAALSLSQAVSIPLFVSTTRTGFTISGVGLGTFLAATTFKWQYHVIQ